MDTEIERADEKPQDQTLTTKLFIKSGFGNSGKTGICNAIELLPDDAEEIEKAITDLRQMLAKREGSNWLLGDQMVFIRQKSKSRISMTTLSEEMETWSPKYAGEKTKFYDTHKVCSEFPEGIRHDDLSFTDHQEVLRAVGTLRKQKRIGAGWTDTGHMERRRELLERIAARKEQARENRNLWNREQIVGVVEASNLVDQTKHAMSKIKKVKKPPTLENKPAKDQPEAEYPTLWRVDTADEDGAMYIVDYLTHGPAFVKVGKVNLKPGTYEIRRVERIAENPPTDVLVTPEHKPETVEVNISADNSFVPETTVETEATEAMEGVQA